MRFGERAKHGLTWCESTSGDSPENKQSSSELRNKLHRSVRAPILPLQVFSSINPAGAPTVSPLGEQLQKTGASFLGFQSVTYWSVPETFFFLLFLLLFLAFSTKTRTNPDSFGDQEPNSDGSFSTCVSVCFLRPVPTPQGARWDHLSSPSHTHRPRPPICSNYPLEFAQEGRE